MNSMIHSCECMPSIFMMPIQTCITTDRSYPKRLLGLPNPPTMLWYQGRWDETKPSIAIIGARACKKESQKIAETLALELAQAGVSIISGGALGIDTAAHQGALLGKAPTCAVLGTGLDQLYPRKNIPLFEKIVQENGCIFSSFPLQSKPKTWHFPKRNELIAALSDGVVFIDSPPSSGSRYTAIAAHRFQKPMFILSGANECADLIKEGAHTICHSQDILQFLLPHFEKKLNLSSTPHLISHSTIDFSALTALAQQVYCCLEKIPHSIDELCLQNNVSLHHCIAALTELEIYGFCHRLSNDTYQTIPFTK